MREIKFRAWFKGRKKIPGYPPRMMDNIHDMYDGAEECFGTFLTHDEYVVMQYTGLQDMHGNDIYESDLVRDEDGVMYTVSWGSFSDCCVQGDTWVIKEEGYQPTLYYCHADLEVIGNIHENPGLLKPEAQGEE